MKRLSILIAPTLAGSLAAFNTGVTPPALAQRPGAQQMATQATRALPLESGFTLKTGQKYPSPSGAYTVTFQDDGNVVIHDRSGGYKWSLDRLTNSRTRTSHVEVRPDGTFGAFEKDGRPLWIAPGRREAGAYLDLTDEGVLELVSRRRTNGRTVLWASDGFTGVRAAAKPQPARPAKSVPAPARKSATPAVYQRYTVQNFRTNPDFNKPIDPERPDYTLLDAALYFATNEARGKEGKGVIPYHPRLEKAAFDYAREMVNRDFFSHQHPSDPAQRGPTDRVRIAGVKNAAAAENIAINFGIQYQAGTPLYTMDAKTGEFSYKSPEGPAIPMHTYLTLADALVDQWMHSPGHRANILSDNNRAFGCGVYFFRDAKFDNMLKCKAVQVFQWFKDVEE